MQDQDNLQIPIKKEDFKDLVEPYDSTGEASTTNLSTVVSRDVARLVDLVLQSELGYRTRSEFVRDAVIKWLMVLTESIKDPDYHEYLIHTTRMRTTHSSQIRRTRQIKGEELILAAEDELNILIEAEEWQEAALAVLTHLESINNIGGLTSRVWLKQYLSNIKIKDHLGKIISKNTNESKILRGILDDFSTNH